MFQKKYLPVKICAGVLLNLLLCLVFFILSSIPDYQIYMSGWHLELFLIWYPLTAAGYGILSVLAACGDRRYFALMSVSFFTVVLINALTMGVVAPPAAFVYTAIMLAAAGMIIGIRMAMSAYMKEYRNYKLKKESKKHEQDPK